MKAIVSRVSVPAAGAALLIGLFVFCDLLVYRDYFLRGDEPAFLSATLASPASWFTSGYFNYFNVYPEWPILDATPLLKPVTNAVGYVNYALFGRAFALHYAVFFAMQFFGLLLFVRLLRELKVSPLPSASLALLFLFNPAFMNAGLTCLSCHFDVLAGVFALASFLALWREWYAAALLLLTLAVFTKESAAYAPIAAALSVFVWRRPPVWAALMLVPLALWAAARFLAYGEVFHGAFASPFSQIATGLATWPTGLVPYRLAHAPGTIPSGWPEILFSVFLLANLILWPFLGYAVVATVRKRFEAPHSGDLAVGLLIWMLGALSFGVLAGFSARYGGSMYPFLYLFLAALMFVPGYRVPRRALAGAFAVFLAVTLVQGARGVRSVLFWQSAVAPERALYEALKSLPQDGRTVYVVNAPQAYTSAPHYLNVAWSLNLNVVIVNQFRGCTTSSDAKLPQLSGSGLLDIRVPGCATLKFGVAVPDFLNRGIDRALERKGVGIYRFSDPAADTGPYTRIGRTLAFRLASTSADATFIGYDWSNAAYRVIAPGEPS